MSAALKTDNGLDNKSIIQHDDFITAKDLKIAFFEFTRDVLDPKFTHIETEFSNISKTLTEIKSNIRGIFIFCAFLVGGLGTGFWFVIAQLIEISAKLPK